MGHPTAIFLNPPDPNYKCAICLDVFDDPVSLLKCGHTFCRSCLDSSLCQSGRNCPECRTEIDLEDRDDDENDSECEEDNGGNGNVVHSVRVIKSAIGNSMVRCQNCLDENGELMTNDNNSNENSNDGGGSSTAAAGTSSSSPSSQSQPCNCNCNWTGPLSQWPLHSSRHCPIAPVTCPIPGCNHACPRSEMKAHVGSPACVKAAVVSRVESQMNGMLAHLRKRMKKEVERQVCGFRRDKGELERRVEAEKEGRAELMEVNVGLRREVKGLKKVVKRMQQSQSRQSENRQQHRSLQASGNEAVALQPISTQPLTLNGGNSVNNTQRESRKKRKRNHLAVAISPTPSLGAENSDENKRRKKSKKRKKKRQSDINENAEQGRGRMRAVSTDAADVGVRISG